MQAAGSGEGEAPFREPLIGRLAYGVPRDMDEFVILGAARAAVTLPASTPPWVQARVREELDAETATTETVVQAIPLLGKDAVESFSVVVVEPVAAGKPRVVTVVVRGAAAVDVHSVGGRARVAANGLLPWHLVSFSAVGAVEIGGGTAGAGRRGLWQIDPGFPVAVLEAALAGPETVDPSAFEDTRVVAPQLPPASDSASASAAARAPDAAARAPDEGQTRGKRFEIRVGAGDTVPLCAPVIIGRDPRAPRIIRGGAPTLIRVESRTSRVSGSHVEIAQIGGSVVVTDLSSTNGTTVTLPGGSQIKLRQGDSFVTPVHSVIDVGDGNEIEVLLNPA